MKPQIPYNESSLPSNFTLCSYDYDPEQFAGSSIPMLFIGTKADLVETERGKEKHRSYSLADECGAEEINVVCVRIYRYTH